MAQKRIIIGLAAHVDAGKTTLSEAMLYTAGRIRRAGRVDHGDAYLDTDPIEKERGITIFSKQAELEWKKRPITLVDTPGHADFSGEAERALGIVDAAVLVISGTDGPQSHTMTLWKILERLSCPVVLFVNKCDQDGVDQQRVFSGIREKLSGSAVWMNRENTQDEIALCDEGALDYFLRTGSVPDFKVNQLIRERKLFPVLFGSALKMEGIEPLLDLIRQFEDGQEYPSGFGARVYKIARDAQGARLTFIKVTGGELRVRDLVSYADVSEKAAELRFYSGARYRCQEMCPAGEICAVVGLSKTEAGETLGSGASQREYGRMIEPYYTCRLIPKPGQDIHRVLDCLKILSEEEPLIRCVYHERTREIHIESMGGVQLEIIARLMKDRFGILVDFGETGVLYKETILNPVEGVGHYEPLRHYAEVHLLLTPLPAGSGVRVRSDVSQDDLATNWQRLILTHLQEKQHLGVLTGSPITDIELCLIAGKAHLKHTEGGDFRQATYRAVRHGLMKAKSVLLEPWVKLEITVPREYLGRCMNDVTMMGGTVGLPEGEDLITLRAEVPARQASGYPREVQVFTKGQGSCSLMPLSFRPCPDQEARVQAIGYQPEADLENSPDSVFCSHGAGFQVPWQDTEKYMHLPLREEKDKLGDFAAPVPRQTVQYHGTQEEDRELAAIFERTYGPSKTRDLLGPVSKEMHTHPEPVRVDVPEKEYLLVDGYNMIFAWEELKKKADDSLDFARQDLMDIMCEYRSMMNCEVILVFDAYKVKGNAGKAEKYKNIYVVYTKEAQTADSYIEKMTFGTKGSVRVRVATSDGPEQTIVLGNQALRVSAREFHREVDAVMGSIQAFLLKHQNPVPGKAVEQAIKEAYLKKQMK